MVSLLFSCSETVDFNDRLTGNLSGNARKERECELSWFREKTRDYLNKQERLIPAERAERISHGVAALQQRVQAVRLLFQELHSLHLHPQHHAHLTLQAGELVCRGGGGGRRCGEIIRC